MSLIILLPIDQDWLVLVPKNSSGGAIILLPVSGGGLLVRVMFRFGLNKQMPIFIWTAQGLCFSVALCD